MDLIHKINIVRSQPASYWLNSANQYLPGISSVVLIIVIAWYMARLIWIILPQQDEFDWSVKAPVSSGLTGRLTTTSKVNFATIAAVHLFGVPGVEPVIATSVDAPETRLNLKLRGTIAADDPAMAHAIIAEGNGQDEVYFLNDKVAGGAVLHEVHADRVILNRAGAFETLRLPKLSESLGSQASFNTTVSNRLPSGFPSGGSVQQRMPQTASSFTDILRPQPYMPNGEMKGYRIYPGRDRRKFASLGFRPGDLVTEVNGQLLNNLQSGMETFQKLGAASQLTITIERAGQPMVISIDRNEMNSAFGAHQ
jgi:general secretion pathway protein C